MTQSCWASLGLPFTLSPSGLTWRLVFLLMSSCVLFVFSLGHHWSICSLWASSSLFTNSAFSWAITNFIGLPWSNYFILILGVHGLAINPLYTAHGYAISFFLSIFKPIYLLNAHFFISWTCDPSFLPLGPDGFLTCLPNLCCPYCCPFTTLRLNLSSINSWSWEILNADPNFL